jgi:transcriptional regulator with GAF, ATPase, and Fis domain
VRGDRVSPNLIEAALFGHERGAYTGAVSAARGLFEEADGGTLFIDEIGDLELSLQAKLLRAVDKSSVRRIGGTRWIDVDVRIISATRRNLDAEVQAGRFRDDLLFRLGGARIDLPPLRARDGDIRLLAMKFWCDLGGDPAALRPDFVNRLEGYSWPGNARELRHAIVRYLALGDESLTPAKLSQASQPRNPTSQVPGAVPDLLDSIIAEETTFAAGRQRLLDEFERRFVASVLERHGGHVGKAAEAAGVGRRYFQEIRGRHRDGR